jgi:hypothetical protein
MLNGGGLNIKIVEFDGILGVELLLVICPIFFESTFVPPPIVIVDRSLAGRCHFLA